MNQPLVAYWILLVAALMPYAVLVTAKAHKGYDNTDPRDPRSYDTPLRRRAHSAHLNGLEAFPLLAAAVLLAGLRQADAGFVNGAAAVWLVLRLAYVGCYLTGRAALRSLTWFGATFAALAILLAALLR